MNVANLFAGIDFFDGWSPEITVLEFALGFETEDTFHQETAMMVNDILSYVSLSDLMGWYASNPDANLEYMTRWIQEGNAVKGVDGPDVAFGGLYILVEETLGAAYGELKEREQLPWQQPECFYCEHQHHHLKQDRIGRQACRSCWVEAIDGPW